jgi:dipeptidyl aminopeptidase/acylaminoacyl peptidase
VTEVRSYLPPMLQTLGISAAHKAPMPSDEINVAAFLIVVFVWAGSMLSSVAVAQRTGAIPVEDALRVRSFAPLSSIEWSPDGKWLAYVVRDNYRPKPENNDARFGGGVPAWVIGNDVWVSNTDTGEARNLTGGKGESWLPSWSPDGRYLAFVSNRDGNGESKLWLWNTGKDDLEKISDVGVRTERIQWTSTGRSVLVTVAERSSLPVSGVKGPSQVEGQKAFGDAVQGSTVVLYQSRQQGQADEAAQKSDPWDLDKSLRDLVSIDVATGEARLLVHSRKIATYKLSPDGLRIAYTVPKRFERPGSQQILYDLAIVTIATSQDVVVTSNIRLDYDGAEFSWSPDSHLLSYHTGGPNDDTRDCYTVSAGGGLPNNITRFSPQRPPSHNRSSVPLWDTGSSSIYFIEGGVIWKASATRNRASEIARIPSREVVCLSNKQSADFLWLIDQDNAAIVLAHDDIGKQDAFYRFDLRNGNNTKLLERGECYTCANVGQPFASTQDGRHVAYLAQDAQHDLDLWLSDASFQEPRRLTHLNPQFESYKMGATRLIEWLGDDGQRLRGALLLPSDYVEGKSYPLIVWVYGGSLLSDHLDHFGLGDGGAFNFQLLATRGYMVLLPDSPQLEGMPMADLSKTVLPGVNEAIRLGLADPDRLGIMGQSNGGYSTMALIVQTRRFKAAIEMDGMADLIGLYGEMDEAGTTYGTSLEHGQDAMGGTPWEFRERYLENSPYFYLDRIETPVLIVHGSQDSAVAPFLGDQIFAALRRLGKDAEYAKYRGEGHSQLYWSYANQVDFCNRMITWFDKHLRASKH